MHRYNFSYEKPLRKLLHFIDILNIDLKSNDEYYKKLCFGPLKDVENTIRIAHELGCHIEVTTLLIPNENTDDETLQKLGKFLSSVDKNKLFIYLDIFLDIKWILHQHH